MLTDNIFSLYLIHQQHRSMKRVHLFILCILICVSLFSLYQKQRTNGISTPMQQLTPTGTAILGQQVKTQGCVAQNGLPDSACTPGAILQGVSKDQVCTLGYARSVRNVPIEEKKLIYAEYGIAAHRPGEYEVDHLISLELGGSNDSSNLWPESAEPRPGFHEKDRFENYLHAEVCNGALTLEQAQHEIATNWLLYWQQAGNP